MTGDEVSDNCWHPVYQGKMINTVLDFGGNDNRTLGIEKDDVLIEVWPLKHTPQFRYVLLSVGGHCEIHCQYTAISSTPPPSLTLFIITNEHHLPQRRLIPGQDRQVVSNFDLTRFVDDNSLDWDDLHESTVHEPGR